MESSIRFKMPREKSSIIKVIGIGGGGGNAVNHMHAQGIKGVDFIICNTDLQTLEASNIPDKIQLGASLTQGLGAGSNPEVGKRAAMETIEDIIEMLGVNTKMLFITAGMGGGTGTGAAPIIAKTAREMDILTVGIVTTPFTFEGRRRKGYADEGIENLKKAVDCLLIISNDKIKEMYGNLPIRQAFSHANNILTTAAKGIAEIITHPGYINVDFEDVKTVMKGSGVAIMGAATAAGKDRALTAVREALASPLLNDNQIYGAKNILLNIASGHEEVLMEEVELISQYIQEESGLSAEMIFGTSFDESLDDKIAVTLIATGFESKPRENKIIVGSTENNAPSLQANANLKKEEPITFQEIQLKEIPNVIEAEDLPISNKTEDIEIESQIETEPEKATEIRYQLFDESEASQINKIDDSTDGFQLKTDGLDSNNLPSEDVNDDFFLSASSEMFSNHTEELSINEMESILDTDEVFPEDQNASDPLFSMIDSIEDEVNSDEQNARIERHIKRIKELKNLNVTINSNNGVRDLEKEPAYRRRNKKLNEYPHSSENNTSKLSLFEDLDGKSGIRTNNSFLHDNVD